MKSNHVYDSMIPSKQRNQTTNFDYHKQNQTTN